MALVRRTVERIIESDPTIRTGLYRGIINSRALSRYILENCGVDSTPDAVLGILRRYPLDGEREYDHQLNLKDCTIVLRNGIAYLAIENGPDVMRRVGEFASNMRSTRGENFRVVVGSNSVRVIANREALDDFKETFRSKEVISYSTELAEICLLLPHGPEGLGKIATAITAQLTLNGVDPVGILVCPPEDIIIVPEKDASRSYEALQQLLKDETENQRRRLIRPKNGFARSEQLLCVLRLDGPALTPILAS